MILHEAIQKTLQQTGRQMTIQEIADSLNRSKFYQKKDGSKITDFQIHGRIKNYPKLFNRKGSTVSLAGHNILNLSKPKTAASGFIKTSEIHYQRRKLRS